MNLSRGVGFAENTADKCSLHCDAFLSGGEGRLLTFHRHSGSVVVLSPGVHSFALIGAAVLKLHVVQVQMGPRHPHLVIGWQLSVDLLPADLGDGAGKGRGRQK